MKIRQREHRGGGRQGQGRSPRGPAHGNWLTKEQLASFSPSLTRPSSRASGDRALLAVLLGTGLRRNEAGDLTVEHVHLPAVGSAISGIEVNSCSTPARPLDSSVISIES
jgi:integrase